MGNIFFDKYSQFIISTEVISGIVIKYKFTHHYMVLSCGFKIDRFPEDPNYEKYTIDNFDSIFALTKDIWLAPYSYSFSELDNIVKWSLEHNKTVIMDGVIWRCRIPNWLKHQVFSGTEFLKMTLHYVAELLKYPFFSFDLLSELFNYDGLSTDNFWHKRLGDNYLMDILEYATQHKGYSKIVYSDFGIKVDQKWDGIFGFLDSIKNKKLIDAVSIQVHCNILPGFQRNTLVNKIKRLQDLGYEVHIPEIVCWENIYFPGGQVLQAKMYHEIVDICLENKINVIGFGSVYDAHPWNYNSYSCKPGLWDKEYQPKFFTGELLRKVSEK